MIEKPNKWICDTCGDQIESVDDGWVQWLRIRDEENDSFHSEGLELVHARQNSERERSCIYNSQHVFRARRATTADLSLRDFACPDGLMRLLSFISDDEFKDKEEVIEMIKRLFIPGYEQVRRHLDSAVSDYVFEPNTKEGFPHQFQIELVLEWIKNENEELG